MLLGYALLDSLPEDIIIITKMVFERWMAWVRSVMSYWAVWQEEDAQIAGSTTLAGFLGHLIVDSLITSLEAGKQASVAALPNTIAMGWTVIRLYLPCRLHNSQRHEAVPDLGRPSVITAIRPSSSTCLHRFRSHHSSAESVGTHAM